MNDLIARLATAQRDAGLVADAVGTAARVLQLHAADAAARALILRAVPAPATGREGMPASPGLSSAPSAASSLRVRAPEVGGFDWDRAESEIGSVVEPPFVAAVPAPDAFADLKRCLKTVRRL